MESAEEVEKLIRQRAWWEGKKYEVELWRNARARALAEEGVNKVLEQSNTPRTHGTNLARDRDPKSGKNVKYFLLYIKAQEAYGCSWLR